MNKLGTKRINLQALLAPAALVILYIFTQRTFTESLAMSGSKE